MRGGLLDHENTWKTYLESNPDWKDTASLLTGPLLFANVILSMIFTSISGGFAYYAVGHGFFVGLLVGLIMAVIGVVVASLVVSFLAGKFGGKSDFSRAFAAVSLAMIPAWLAGIIAALIPGIGFFLALAGGIMSLVFLYKIIPLALDLPQSKRVAHLIASIVLIIIVQMFLGLALGTSTATSSNLDRYRSDTTGTSPNSSLSGIAGEMERQGRLHDAAKSAVFDRPEDGELNSDQVAAYVSVMRKSQDLQQEYALKMQELSAEAKKKKEEGQEPSAADISRMVSGAGSMMGVSNAEMEIVVTGGGNWAEHQWVKEQLRIAKIQQGDGPDPIAHNYELYQEFKDDLDLFH